MNLDYAFACFSKLIELTRAEKNIFASLAQLVEIDRKHILLAEGQICKYEYFVLKGCLRSFYVDENLKDHTTMFALEGWWTGDLLSFHRDVPSTTGIEALEDTIVLRLTRNQMEELYLRVPKFERYFRILLQNRLLANEVRISHHLSSNAFESYLAFQAKYPTLEQRISQKYIASYLGITPAYLSRLRKRKRRN